MPKLTILNILDQTAISGTVTANYIFWIDVKPGREQANPTVRSVVPQVSTEIALALQSGTLIERAKQDTFAVDISDPDSRKLALQVARKKIGLHLIAEQDAEDRKLNPGMFSGITFDGVKWSDE